MIPALLALLATASAQDPDAANRREAADSRAVPDWSVSTYSAPDTAIEVLCAKQTGSGNDCLTIHIAAAVSGGVQFHYKSSPDWFGEIRGGGELRYGLLSNGYGLGASGGTYWGIDRTHYRLTAGPTLIANFYQGLDYTLRPGFGGGLELMAIAKPWETFWLQASAQPAVFVSQPNNPQAGPNRSADIMGFIDELEYKVGAKYVGRNMGSTLRNGPIIGAGYTWRRNAGGLQHGFYISGSF